MFNCLTGTFNFIRCLTFFSQQPRAPSLQCREEETEALQEDLAQDHVVIKWQSQGLNQVLAKSKSMKRMEPRVTKSRWHWMDRWRRYVSEITRGFSSSSHCCPQVAANLPEWPSIQQRQSVFLPALDATPWRPH